MTTCTPVYGLTYATGTDRPCDIYQPLCAFADDVEVQLGRLDGIVDRVIDSVPMAQVRLTTPFQYNNGIGGNFSLALPFDTVDVDTANMVDLTVNSQQILLPRYGRYLVGARIQTGYTVPANDPVGQNIDNAWDADGWFSDGSNPMYLDSSMIVYYSPSPAPATDLSSNAVHLFYGAFSAGIHTINSAKLFVAWIGDLP